MNQWSSPAPEQVRREQVRKGTGIKNSNRDRRLELIRGMNLEEGDLVKLELEASDPLNGIICRVVKIEWEQGTVRLANKRYLRVRPGVKPRAFDPSQFTLHQKKA